jgi:hypothetical protein
MPLIDTHEAIIVLDAALTQLCWTSLNKAPGQIANANLLRMHGNTYLGYHEYFCTFQPRRERATRRSENVSTASI